MGESKKKCTHACTYSFFLSFFSYTAHDFIVCSWQGTGTAGAIAGNTSDAAIQLPYQQLYQATGGFGDKQEIGGGGSCLVYQATLYNTRVAIKALGKDFKEKGGGAAGGAAAGAAAGGGAGTLKTIESGRFPAAVLMRDMTLV